MGNIWQIILETFWLLLPAGIANTAPVLAAKYNWFPSLNQPLNERLLGSHKTWRGVFFGVIYGLIAGIILGHGALFGAALGLAALIGDAVKSFFKRRLHIAPGKSFPVFDQIDFVIGALLVSILFFPVKISHVVIAIVMFGLLSCLTSLVGKQLKIKKSL